VPSRPGAANRDVNPEAKAAAISSHSDHGPNILLVYPMAPEPRNMRRAPLGQLPQAYRAARSSVLLLAHCESQPTPRQSRSRDAGLSAFE
jgi:hypothetical protein